MKTVRLLFIVCAMCGFAQVRAQSNSEDYHPIVLMMLSESDANAYPATVEGVIVEQCNSARTAMGVFETTRREGFQQTHNPPIIFTSRDNRFALGVGLELLTVVVRCSILN